MISKNALPLRVEMTISGSADALDGVARRTADGRSLSLQVTNVSDRPQPAQLHLSGFTPSGPADVTEISGEVEQGNDAANPRRIALMSAFGREISMTAPPSTLSRRTRSQYFAGSDSSTLPEGAQVTQDPTILPYVSGTTHKRPRLIGIYILGSLGIVIAIVLLLDGLLQGGNIGTVYETPSDRLLSASILLAGGILFLASLAAVLWLWLPRRIVLGLQVAAALSQLPAVRQTAVAVSTFKRSETIGAGTA